MKEQELIIEGSITPESVLNLCAQIESLNLEVGDKVKFIIDSEGGYVDSGLILAKCIEGLQDMGVIGESVAGGKVWSAAMLPYLACSIRSMGSAGSFLIHKVAVPVEENSVMTDVDLSALQGMIWRDSNLISEFYRSHGVSEEACRHLWEGDDLIVSNELEALAYGIITDANIVKSPINMRWNNLFLNKKNLSKRMVCKATPCIVNFKSSNMDEKKFEEKFAEVENRLNAKIDDLSEKIMNALVTNKSKNEDDEELKAEPMNAEPLTEEELKQLGGHMTKTPVTVEGNDAIKWLAHTGKDVEKDHFVIPISKDGKAEMLPEGDYKAEIDGESFMIHSTGVDSYLHGRGTENDGEEDVKVENEKVEEDVKVEAKSKAPINRKAAPQAPNKFKKYWEMSIACGKGGVGLKSLKK